MKRNLLVSFLLVVVMIMVMRWQGSALVTPMSPKGIIDLEFARTAARLDILKLFWDLQVVRINIYLDFLFIAAYAWFLCTACLYIGARTGWGKWSRSFMTVALGAALFDVFENFLMLLIINGRFSTGLLELVFYAALIKFLLVGSVVLFLLLAWPFALRKRRS